MQLTIQAVHCVSLGSCLSSSDIGDHNFSFVSSALASRLLTFNNYLIRDSVLLTGADRS